MATNSYIAIEREDGTINSVYCHYDGYLENNGLILYNSYDKEKTEKLIDLGYLSFICENVSPPEGVSHSFESPCKNVTVAYHRDRGEPKQIAFYPSRDAFMNIPNTILMYLMGKDGVWLSREWDIEKKRYKFTPLKDLLLIRGIIDKPKTPDIEPLEPGSNSYSDNEPDQVPW